MAKERILQDMFLKTLQKEKVSASVYLVNGIKLQGLVDAFDDHVVALKGNITQLIYKHAISTVVPTQPMDFSLDEAEAVEEGA